jgi:hypothetical protein
MLSVVVTTTTIVITYNEAVKCPTATFPFVYDSSTATSGGTVSGCTAVGDVLTLATSAILTAPAASASLVYSAPGLPSAANAVSGTNGLYAAGQTLLEPALS